MCSCDFDSPDFRAVAHPVARKDHQCDECIGSIVPGERYKRVTFGVEGSVERWKVCATCAAWGEALAVAQRAACGCSGWEIGAMWEAIAEFVEEHLSEAALAQRERDGARLARIHAVMGA